ncbi:MAG: amidohydrolase family protein [Bdellovibrionota bacterium]
MIFPEGTLIIDSHVHVFPDALGKIAPAFAQGPVAVLRKRARSWWRPVSSSMHKMQTMLRHLPGAARFGLDEISGLAPLPSLLIEGTPHDLREETEAAGVSKAFVIAHPPYLTNETVLALAEEDPRLVPVVNIPRGTMRPGITLKKLVEQGARALKIHPAADGEGVESPRYRSLLRAASELGLPVILHTGCIHTHLLYRSPQEGKAERFEPWFKAFPNVKFVLAHLNFHEPLIALDLMERYPNLYADTSWQPAEIIGEAVRRVGAERILFGTDWPFVGGNLRIGLERIQDCIETGTMTEPQSRQILGENALKLFALEGAPAHAV